LWIIRPAISTFFPIDDLFDYLFFFIEILFDKEEIYPALI